MSDNAYITAKVANDPLVALTDAAIVTWQAKLDEANAAYETKKAEEIDEVIATKKTFWTRRTRTRDEAERYLKAKYDYHWLLTERQRIYSADRNLTRLKEVLAIAVEPAFENITLTEFDLLLVGGQTER